jgi:hypothetical protein
MERLETIERLIEAGREEAPRIAEEAPRFVAERSREAVESVEAGVAAALAAARDRLRPEPRRPSVGRMLVMGLATAIAVAALGIVLAVVVERGQRWLQDRRARGRFDPLVQEAERASDALEPDAGAEPALARNAPMAIPVGPASDDDGVEIPREDRVPA